MNPSLLEPHYEQILAAMPTTITMPNGTTHSLSFFVSDKSTYGLIPDNIAVRIDGGEEDFVLFSTASFKAKGRIRVAMIVDNEVVNFTLQKNPDGSFVFDEDRGFSFRS